LTDKKSARCNYRADDRPNGGPPAIGAGEKVNSDDDEREERSIGQIAPGKKKEKRIEKIHGERKRDRGGCVRLFQKQCEEDDSDGVQRQRSEIERQEGESEELREQSAPEREKDEALRRAVRNDEPPRLVKNLGRFGIGPSITAQRLASKEYQPDLKPKPEQENPREVPSVRSTSLLHDGQILNDAPPLLQAR